MPPYQVRRPSETRVRNGQGPRKDGARRPAPRKVGLNPTADAIVGQSEARRAAKAAEEAAAAKRVKDAGREAAKK